MNSYRLICDPCYSCRTPLHLDIKAKSISEVRPPELCPYCEERMVSRWYARELS